MLEKNHTSKKEHDEIRECVAQHLGKALRILQDTSEKCAVHKLWYLAPGIPVYKIEEVIFQLNHIIDRTRPRIEESGDIKW
jgi:hypothetical protein